MSRSYSSEILGNDDSSSELKHAGSLDISELNLFIGYGVSNILNLYVNLPIKRISQNPVEEDIHHRTESISGIGDTRISFKWILRNQRLGPGWRIFFGTDYVLPTGDSNKHNPFLRSFISTDHRHFALGDGSQLADVSFEVWHRSEFPFVMGATIRQGIYSSTTKYRFRSGLNSKLTIHAIRQRAIFRNVFPYLKLTTRNKNNDEWDGKAAPNSGGTFVDGTLGFNLEVNDKVSGVINFDFPIWKSVTGDQLDSFRFVFSFRRIIN